MQDITEPKVGVQIQVREDGRVLWVNVDGKCVLRVSQAPLIEFEWQGVRPIKLNSDELHVRRDFGP